MADRYQERPFPADDNDRGGDPRASAKDEGDPLAELARLIGQTDPFGSMGRANRQLPPRPTARDQYQPPSQHRPSQHQPSQHQPAQYQPAPQYQPPPQYQHPVEPDVGLRAGAPPWLQRASRQEIPEQDSTEDYPSAVHPLQRYAAARPPEPDYQDTPAYADEPNTE